MYSRNRTYLIMDIDVVGDDRCRFIADPFFLDSRIILFELFLQSPREKVIAAADISYPLPRYLGTVLRESGIDFSFPFTFLYNGTQYCLPGRSVCNNGSKQYATHVYRVSQGSLAFDDIGHLGVAGADPVVFPWHDRWFLICAQDGALELYVADNPLSRRWTRHPASPIARDLAMARMAGRPIETESGLVLFYQDCRRRYGEAVRAFRVSTLDSDTFAQNETNFSPIVAAQYNHDWNHHGMHHVDIDLNRARALVDGHHQDRGWRLALLYGVDRLDRLYPTPRTRWFFQSLYSRFANLAKCHI